MKSELQQLQVMYSVVVVYRIDQVSSNNILMTATVLVLGGDKLSALREQHAKGNRIRGRHDNETQC